MPSAKPLPLLVPRATASAVALAEVPGAPLSGLAAPARPIDLIVIHCSATPNGRPLQRGAPGEGNHQNCVQIIDAWHGERGFERPAADCRRFNPGLAHIGYHFVIDITGEVLPGRSLDEIGAHVAGYNTRSIGICMVGGLERDGTFTPAQWKALASLVLLHAGALHIDLSPPRRNGNQVGGGVCGHRDLSPDTNHDNLVEPAEWLKTCPGFDVGAWLANRLQPQDKNICKGAA